MSSNVASEPAAVPATASAPGRAFARASKACRRCRRLRTKCMNQGEQQSCSSCRQAKVECVFLRRGEVDFDRKFRQRATRQDDCVPTSQNASFEGNITRERHPADQNTISTPSASAPSAVSCREPSLARQPSTPRTQLGWEALPPFEEVVEGIETMITSFFQLGFVPKALFFERLHKDHKSVSVFLLLSILGISARFTPSLVRRYKGGSNATRLFLDRAACLVQEQMFSPALESIQGFFLMSIAEWGNGDKNRGLVYMGIAVRLAGIRRLHREDTYELPSNASREEIVYSEEARRTFWMLETFENLHSGSDSPVVFSYPDLTVLLPSHEHEFTFGTQPSIRAALTGTAPAIRDPSLVTLPSRSFFAVLLQTHNLWGKVARLVSADAGVASSRSESRISGVEYTQLSQELIEFEAGLPIQYHWSDWNLRGFRVEGLDLAYFSAVMVLGLSNIILRRSYLHDILISPPETSAVEDPLLAEAWPKVADELFEAMLKLNEQIRAFFQYRSVDQGYPALIVFSVYVCGSLANHLRLQPRVCPRLAPQADDLLKSSIKGLSKLQSAWPVARRWYLALEGASERASSRSQPVGDVQGPLSPESQEMDVSLAYDLQFNETFPTEAMFSVFGTSWAGDYIDTGDLNVVGDSNWAV